MKFVELEDNTRVYSFNPHDISRVFIDKEKLIWKANIMYRSNPNAKDVLEFAAENTARQFLARLRQEVVNIEYSEPLEERTQGIPE